LKTRFIIAAIALSAAAHSQTVWGSFDATRVNYAGGVLSNGASHTMMRNVITGTGATIAASTPTLTAAYLSGVDVFYTSLLADPDGALSAGEQTDLQNWIAGGGTLIVTADIFPTAAYNSFTSVYGVTYSSISNTGTGNVTAAHPITTGVSTYAYTTNAGLTYGANAMALGDDGFGNDYILVMEPGTGFNVGGRIAVFADHNMFADSFIGSNDNTLLATNLANWAAVVPEPGSFVVLGAAVFGLAAMRRLRR
jgi:hypothetical protein